MVSADAADVSKMPMRMAQIPRMRPENFIVVRPAAKNLTSKASRKISLSARRTYFSNVRRFGVLPALFMALTVTCVAQVAQPGPAASLYRRIGNLGLDPQQVYNIRDAALDREDIHISLDDGTVAFTEAINGRITGALFEGEGTVLIVPPNQVERHSLGMFTGSAVLNQRFTKAYFRFDDARFVRDLQPYMRALEDAAAFIGQHDSLAKSMSAMDSLRLLVALTRQTATATD